MILSGLACMFYQDDSLLQFQQQLADHQHSSNLHSQFAVQKIPSDSQMRDVLDVHKPSNFIKIFKLLCNKLERANYLNEYKSTLGGYLCSMDGTQYFNSYKVKCKHCLTTKKPEDTLYSHKALQAAIVKPKVKTVIPLMPVEIANHDLEAKKQDSERKAAFRMVKITRKNHPELSLTMLCDGLYAETPFIKHVLSHNYNYIITSKPKDNKYLHEEFGRLSLTTHDPRHRLDCYVSLCETD